VKLQSKLAVARSVMRYQLDHKPVPVAVAWLVTGRCTSDCAYCRWKDLRSCPELDTEAALDMIAQMREARVRLVSFTGGEPLLREDIGRLVEAVKRGGMACKLNSNGALVPARIDALRQLDLLQISLDGPPALQDRLRGAGSAERAARAVRAAREAGIAVKLVTCITRDNVRGLDEVLEHAASLGVRIHVQPLTADPRPAGDEPSAPDPIELSAALRRLLALKRSRSPMARWLGTSRAELLYYLQVSRGELRGCHCALVTATMLPDGGLIFCGSGRGGAVEDARSLGFAKAFSRLTLPECEGCTCAGKLRISRVFQLDPRAWIDQLLG